MTTPACDGASTDSEASRRLARMFEAQFDFVWRFLRRLGVESGSTEDEAQRVFLIAAEKLDQTPEHKERALLVGVALRVAANARRSQSRRRRGSEVLEEDEVMDYSPTQEELVIWKERRAQLDLALDQLSFEQRGVFVLAHLEGMSRREIARLTGIAEGTVASRLRAADRRFYDFVARLQREPSGGNHD